MVNGTARIFIAATILGILSLAENSQSISEAARKSNQANALVQAGEAERAIPIYEELIAASPNEVLFRLNLSIALYKARRYRETVKECDSLSKSHPELFPAWLFLGASYLKLGAISAAEAPLRRAVSIQPTDPNAHILLADALLAMEHWEESVEHYEISAQTIPDNPRVWFGLNNDYEALAAKSLASLENVAPQSTEALGLSCALEFDRNQLAAAYQHCRQAMAMRPSFSDLRELVAKIYEETGHPDWAATERVKAPPHSEACSLSSLACEYAAGDFRDVAAAKADSADTIYWQAEAFLALSRQAYQHLQKLPRSRESYEAAAVADEARGRYPEAAAVWRQALQMEPSDEQLQRRLVLALCHGNDCLAALPLLKEQLAHNPTSVELNYLCGLAFNSTRNPDQAISYLETALRQDGKFLPAHAALGEAYLEAGKAERAIPHLKAASLDDPDGSRHYQLARAYQAAGMRDQSAAVLSEYREIVRRRRIEEVAEPAITPP